MSATAMNAQGNITVASNCANPTNDHVKTSLPHFLHGTVSLCTQRPALHTGSVKSNVCFTSSFDSRRYLRIMQGCCLDEDFHISVNPSSGINDPSTCVDPQARAGVTQPSDEKAIGQGGSKLSGGQRLRVGIARALYARSDIVLLDDPLSALDTSTAHRVMRFLYKLCREEQRVLILATNDVHLVCHCDDRIEEENDTTSASPSPSPNSQSKTSIVFLSQDRGKIVQGSYTEVYAESVEFRNIVDSECQDRQQVTEAEDLPPSFLDKAAMLTVVEKETLDGGNERAKKDITKREEEDEKAEEDEEAELTDLGIETFERGHIQSSVIFQYLHAMSMGVAVLILLSALCMQVGLPHTCNSFFCANFERGRFN